MYNPPVGLSWLARRPNNDTTPVGKCGCSAAYCASKFQMVPAITHVFTATITAVPAARPIPRARQVSPGEASTSATNIARLVP